MNRRTKYFAPWSLIVLLGTMAGCGSNATSPVAPQGDTVAPTVNSTDPLNGATSVLDITASFSEAMNPSTITAATFTVIGPGASPVTGTIAYSSSLDMASFVPSAALSSNTSYTAMITTGAQDVAGNALAINHAWSFTTKAAIGGGGPGPGGTSRNP